MYYIYNQSVKVFLFSLRLMSSHII